MDGLDRDQFPALADFYDGFTAGYRDEPREKNRGATYNNAYKNGVEARKRQWT